MRYRTVSDTGCPIAMRASCCAPCPSVVPRPSATASPPTAGRAVSHSSRHGSRRPRRRAWTVISSAIGEWGRRRGVPWHAPERQRSPTSAFIRRRGPSSSRAQRAALRKWARPWSGGAAAWALLRARAVRPLLRARAVVNVLARMSKSPSTGGPSRGAIAHARCGAPLLLVGG